MDEECLLPNSRAPHDALSTAVVATSSPPWQRWIRRCAMTLMILIICYVIIAWWTTRQDVEAAVQRFPATTLISVIVLVSVGIILRIVRWHYYTAQLHWRLPLGESALVFLASLAFTATPGKAGEAVKFALLRERYGISISAGMGVLIVERLGDVIAVFILSIASVGLVKDLGAYLLIPAIAIVAATAFLVSNIYEPLLSRLVEVRRFSGAARRVLGALDACRQLLRPCPFLVGMSLAVLAWSCEAIAFLQLTRSAELGTLLAFSIYGASTLVGALSMLPGGLGGFEAVMVLLLAQVGWTLATSMPVVVIFRLCTLWFGIALGGLAMLGWFVVFRSESYALSLQREAK